MKKRQKSEGTAEAEGQDGETGGVAGRARWKSVPRQAVNLGRRRQERVNTATAFSLSPSFQGVFELFNKNSGLCIKLQFGKTKLSGAIIILISKKKNIKPLQIFRDYSALGDLFPHPSSSSGTIVEISPALPATHTLPLSPGCRSFNCF